MEGSSTFSALSIGDLGLEETSKGRVSSHKICPGDGSIEDVRRANVDMLDDCGLCSFNCDCGEYLEGGKSIPGANVPLDMKKANE
jgi:hypothetical protein